MLFILITDIDKSYKSWYEWIPYNKTTKLKTNFVAQLKKMGCRTVYQYGIAFHGKKMALVMEECAGSRTGS